MSIKVCVSGVVREVGSIKVGVSGTVKNVTEGFCGVGGVARRFFGVPPSGPTTLWVECYNNNGDTLTITAPENYEEIPGPGANTHVELGVEIGDEVILACEFRRFNAEGSNCKLVKENAFRWRATITAFDPYIVVEMVE